MGSYAPFTSIKIFSGTCLTEKKNTQNKPKLVLLQRKQKGENKSYSKLCQYTLYSLQEQIYNHIQGQIIYLYLYSSDRDIVPRITLLVWEEGAHGYQFLGRV